MEQTPRGSERYIDSIQALIDACLNDVEVVGVIPFEEDEPSGLPDLSSHLDDRENIDLGYN